MTARAIRAVLYLRLSRDHADSTSIASQRADCLTLCRSRGWSVVDEAVDLDTSGSRPVGERPGLARLLTSPDTFDVLIVAQADRASRSVGVALHLLACLDESGRTLVTARERTETNTVGGRRAFLSSVATAEIESGLIQARILRSRAALEEAPRWIGGNAPYGYRIVASDTGGKHLAIDDVNAGRMRDIIQRIVAGETVTAVCRGLNATHVPSPGTVSSTTGRITAWSPTVLRRMLRSPAILGHRVTGNGHDRRAVVDSRGRPVIVGPPLVPTDLWGRLQATLAARDTPPQRSKAGASLLLHIAHCAECDARLHYNSRRLLHSGTANDVYRCSRGCAVLVSASRLEEAVQEWTLRELGALRSTSSGPAPSTLLAQLSPKPPNPSPWASTGESVCAAWAAADRPGRRRILLDLHVRVTVSPARGERRWNPDRLRLSAGGPG
ncbi:recombinase family protein [Streptomyces hydrogenans]|uniref:recombinase family protein n=1 Tax=Streptomyces hydrogenans TaxID=1873719 RepID=UPI003D7095F7